MSKGLDDHAAEIARLYADGRTMRQIAPAYGVSPQAISDLLRRHGIPARDKGIPGGRAGSAHPRWKGDDAGYTSLHRRVYALRGQPSHCERCGTTDPARTYHWANLTGNYADPGDYERMCVSCHRRYDNARRRAVKVAS